MSQFNINFENYELLPGVELGEEDKQCLIDTLKVVLYRLDSVRAFKQETFDYCDEHLHLSPGEIDVLFPFDEIHFDSNASYVPEAKDYHVLLPNGKIFLYALFSLVKNEKYRFGYLWNYLSQELYARHIISAMPELVSESAVKFAVDFDCIRQGFDDIPIGDRVSAYKSLLQDSLNRDRRGFSDSEIEHLVIPICETLERLLHDAELELEQSNVTPDNDDDDDESDENDSFAEVDTPETLIDISGNEEKQIILFYSPKILGMDYYGEVELALNPDYASSWRVNRHYFQEWLNGTFQNSYRFNPSARKMECDHSLTAKALYKLRIAYQDYLKRLQRGKLCCDFLHDEDCTARWLKVTLECIDEAFELHNCIITDEFDDRGIRCIADTIWFKHKMLHELFEAILDHENVYSSLGGELGMVINYDFWPDTFRETYDQYHGQIALSPTLRAIVYMEPNREYFVSWLDKACNLFMKKARSDDYDYNDLCERLHAFMTKTFSDLFSDYVQRAKLLNPSEYYLTEAGLFWIFNSMRLVNKLYKRRLKRLADRSYLGFYAPNSDEEFIDSFFVDCCLRVLSATLSSFIEDCIRVHEGDLAFYPWRPLAAAKAYDPEEEEGWAEQHEPENVIGVATELTNAQEEAEESVKELNAAEKIPVEGDTYCQSALDEYLGFYSGISPAVKSVIKQFLIDKVGFGGGAKEFVYFAALDDKSILKIPEFSSFRRMFPRYDDDSKSRNYSSYLGASGRYLFTFRKSKKHKKDVDSAIKEINSILSAAGIKTKK